MDVYHEKFIFGLGLSESLSIISLRNKIIHLYINKVNIMLY